MKANCWSDEQEAHRRQSYGVRSAIFSNPDTYTEAMAVDATDISVKVGLRIPRGRFCCRLEIATDGGRQRGKCKSKFLKRPHPQPASFAGGERFLSP